MPIYEYRCQACGLEKEFLQKLSDAPITECPSCGKAAMTKLVSAAGFQLKGTGWYATDFKNSGAKPAKSDGDKAADAKPGDAKPGDAGGSKSEAAPACGAGACPACQ
jgi:putative FmdB family regulatory protein